MEPQGQGTIRWLILAALLLGAFVWYSWTAHQGEPSLIQAAVEVRSAEQQPTAD